MSFFFADYRTPVEEESELNKSSQAIAGVLSQHFLVLTNEMILDQSSRKWLDSSRDQMEIISLIGQAYRLEPDSNSIGHLFSFLPPIQIRAIVREIVLHDLKGMEKNLSESHMNRIQSVLEVPCKF